MTVSDYDAEEASRALGTWEPTGYGSEMELTRGDGEWVSLYDVSEALRDAHEAGAQEMVRFLNGKDATVDSVGFRDSTLRSLGIKLGMDSHSKEHTEDEIYNHVLWLEKREYERGLRESAEELRLTEKRAEKAESSLSAHLEVRICAVSECNNAAIGSPIRGRRFCVRHGDELRRNLNGGSDG